MRIDQIESYLAKLEKMYDRFVEDMDEGQLLHPELYLVCHELASVNTRLRKLVKRTEK